jgi:hypothetical protein
MRPRWPKISPLNIAHQLCDLERLYPNGEGRIARDRLVWRRKLKPSAFSREYLVQIDYQEGHFPTVRVLQPTINELSGGKKIPHVFNDVGDPLCLFYAPAREWNSSMLIARTIVPWTCEWLFHFEAWLFTGKWDGGGIHHDSESQNAQMITRHS